MILTWIPYFYIGRFYISTITIKMSYLHCIVEGNFSKLNSSNKIMNKSKTGFPCFWMSEVYHSISHFCF